MCINLGERKAKKSSGYFRGDKNRSPAGDRQGYEMRSCTQWGLKAVLGAGSGEQSFGQKLLSTP